MASPTVLATYRLSPQQQAAYVKRIMIPFHISTFVAALFLIPTVVYMIWLTLPIAPTAGAVFGLTVLGFTVPLTYLLYRSLQRIYRHLACSIVDTIDEQGIRRQLVEDNRPPIDGLNKVTYRNVKRTFNQTTQLDFNAIVAIEWQNDSLWVQTEAADPSTAVGILHIPKELDQIEDLEQLLRQQWQAPPST